MTVRTHLRSASVERRHQKVGGAAAQQSTVQREYFSSRQSHQWRMTMPWRNSVGWSGAVFGRTAGAVSEETTMKTRTVRHVDHHHNKEGGDGR